MARMQIVPLPTIRYSGLERTPFIIVLDQLEEDAMSHEDIEILRMTTGAESVVAHAGVLDAADVQLTDAERAALIDRLGLSEALQGGVGGDPLSGHPVGPPGRWL